MVTVEKKEAIEKIEQGLKWEEDFILDYDKPLVWELLKTAGDEKFRRIEKLLKANIHDTERHYSTIKEILEKMEKKEQ